MARIVAERRTTTSRAWWRRRASRTLVLSGVLTGVAHGVAAQLPQNLSPVEQQGTMWCEALHYAATRESIGYRRSPGGSYCEGVARELRRASSFTPVSFTDGRRLLEVRSPAQLFLAWPVDAADTVRLSVSAPTETGLYWLEAQHGGGVFSWPSRVLLASRARIGEAGFLAWHDRPVGGDVHRVYVPLRVGESPGSASAGSFQLELTTPETVREVRIAVSRVALKGGPETSVYSERVAPGVFSAGDRLRITIQRSRLKGSAIYHVIVTGSSASRLLLQHLYFYAF